MLDRELYSLLVKYNFFVSVAQNTTLKRSTAKAKKLVPSSHMRNQRQAATRNRKSYKKYLVDCLNLVNGTSHSKDHSFTDNELYELTPEKIIRYLAFLSYGKEDPDIDTEFPTHGRSSSLEFAKKAISSFMPNKNMVWNERSNEGNPTRSADVNDFIKVVKKAEVRKLGVPSQARRAFSTNEFWQIIARVRRPGTNGISNKYSLAAYYIFQCHMIA